MWCPCVCVCHCLVHTSELNSTQNWTHADWLLGTNNKQHHQSDLHKTQETQSKAKHVMIYTNHIRPHVCVCVCLSVCFCMQHLRRDLQADSARHRSPTLGVQELACSKHCSDLPFLHLVRWPQGKNGVQDCSDVHGDWLLCGLCVWMDPGLFHNANRDLDLVWSRQHSLDYFKLLLQPVEGLYIWFNWSIWLQRNSINACTEL